MDSMARGAGIRSRGGNRKRVYIRLANMASKHDSGGTLEPHVMIWLAACAQSWALGWRLHRHKKATSAGAPCVHAGLGELRGVAVAVVVDGQ